MISDKVPNRENISVWKHEQQKDFWHQDLLWWPEQQVVFPISVMACDVTAGLFMSEAKSNYVIECCLAAAAAVM